MILKKLPRWKKVDFWVFTAHCQDQQQHTAVLTGRVRRGRVSDYGCCVSLQATGDTINTC